MEDPFQFLNEGAGLTPEQVERLRGEMGRAAPLSRLPSARLETEVLVLGRLDAALGVYRHLSERVELGPRCEALLGDAIAYLRDQFRLDGPCFFPLPGADRGEQLEILAEIRDLLKRQAGWRPAGDGAAGSALERVTAERDGLRKRAAELENELARARGQLPPGWSCRSAPPGETL